MTPDLFVCHASEDGASHARHLTTEFETRGLRCWMAPRDIPAGSSWQSAIVAAIESSRAMLLLITPHSNASLEVEKEVALASHLKKTIFPVRTADIALSGALLYQTQTRQWRDLFEDDAKVVEEISEQVRILRDELDRQASAPTVESGNPVGIGQIPQAAEPIVTPYISTDRGRPSIAVLPFKNMTGDPAQEYFADGLVEDIISALSRIQSIVVIARNSSFTYKGRSVGLKQVGRELGVRYALEGSVRKSAERMRVTGQLDDTETTDQLWAGRFDGAAKDVFDLQDQITSSVVAALEIELRNAEIKRLRQRPTNDLTAYDHLVRGLSSFYEHTAEGIREAIKQFYKVIALDPACATAYGYAATMHLLQRTQGWESDPEEGARECLRLSNEAATRGVDDAEALSLAALVRICLGYEVAASAELAERSLMLNANSAWGWYASGLAGISLGNFSHGVESIGRSIRLNPRDPAGYAYFTSYGLALFLASNYEEAIKASDKAVAINPVFLPALRIKAASLAMLGRKPEAKTVLDKVSSIYPSFNATVLTQSMIPLRPEDFAFYRDALKSAGMN
jgi:TolB-like protein